MGFKNATVYVVRHGETVGNDTKLIMHPNEDVLNAVGKTQASNLGQALKDVNFTEVYTSNYPRTIETASIILSHNSKNTPPPTKVDERLREIGIEHLYGKPYATIFRALIMFLNSGRPLDEFSVEDSEPIPEVRKRSKEFLLVCVDLLEDISGSTSTPTILLVSHGACIRFLLEHFTDSTKFVMDGWDPSALNITRNTGCTMFQVRVPDETEAEQKIHIKFDKIHDFSHFSKEMIGTDSLTRATQTPEGKCLSGCFQV